MRRREVVWILERFVCCFYVLMFCFCFVLVLIGKLVGIFFEKKSFFFSGMIMWFVSALFDGY